MTTSPRFAQRLAAAAALLALCCALFTPISAEPPPLTRREKQFLQIHNQARATVGANFLAWSHKLAKYAQQLAADQQRAGRGSASCVFSKQAELSSYGVNQAVDNVMVLPKTIVGKWLAGRSYYNRSNGSCGPEEHRNECRNYAQVVSIKTKGVGCGSAGCGKNGSLNICLYDPRG